MNGMDDTDELVEALVAAGGWCAPEVPPPCDGVNDCTAELRAGVDDHLVGVYERLWNMAR